MPATLEGGSVSDHVGEADHGPVTEAGDPPRSLHSLGLDQAVADAEQSAADADQSAADADQAAAAEDQASADREQSASDRAQAMEDLDQAGDPAPTAAALEKYEVARTHRVVESIERGKTRTTRTRTMHDRDATAARRDEAAKARDEAARIRDAHIIELARAVDLPDRRLTDQLERLTEAAAADRRKAANERRRSATDRAKAARERERMDDQLRAAHVDDLTGAYRRELGRTALSNEMDRARRTDGRLIVAFVDIDKFKTVNDTLGHAAGDRVLQTVVATMRARLRSFDPIVRYGGDEFVCGLSTIDLADAASRFEGIGAAIEEDANVTISVGLSALDADDTLDTLIDRADAAMFAERSRVRPDLFGAAR